MNAMALAAAALCLVGCARRSADPPPSEWADARPRPELLVVDSTTFRRGYNGDYSELHTGRGSVYVTLRIGLYGVYPQYLRGDTVAVTSRGDGAREAR